MGPRIIIACDSFKGSVSSAEIAQAACRVLNERMPGLSVAGIAVADGGEGITEAIASVRKGETIILQVSDPLSRAITARYTILDDRTTAVIEMAAAGGLTLLAPAERDPMNTHTGGTGEMIRDALNRGCRHFILGIGGSATNDAGFGMLQALGARFYNHMGDEITPTGSRLSQIARIDTGQLDKRLASCRFTVACDVDNPLYGPQGAAYIYAPQKGAAPETLGTLDEGLRQAARLIRQTTGVTVDTLPGAGAAGGLGGSCRAFLNARLHGGFEVVSELIGLNEKLTGAELVITGEGRLDRQTCNGKTPYGVLLAAQKQGIPVVAVGGSIDWCPELRQAGFAGIFPVLSRPVPPDEAMQKEFALHNICETTVQIVRLFFSGR